MDDNGRKLLTDHHILYCVDWLIKKKGKIIILKLKQVFIPFKILKYLLILRNK